MKILVALTHALRRHRRLLAACCAFLVVLGLTAQLRPPAPETVPVVVAARELPGGVTLASTDLTIAHLPRAVAPHHALSSLDALRGRVLASPVDKGVPLTERAVVGPALSSSSPGRVLAPLRLPDADLASLLQPGLRVDVIAAGDQQAHVLARGARIVAIPAAESGGSGPFAGGRDTRGLLVICEVTPDEATAIAQTSAHAKVGVALH